MAGESARNSVAEVRRRGVRGMLVDFSDAIVNVFFPAGCRICNELLTGASRVPLCEACLSSFERLPGVLCEICGRPLPGFAKKEGEPLLLAGLQGANVCLRQGAQLCSVRRRGGAGDSVAEIRADRAAGSVVCRATGRTGEGGARFLGCGRGSSGTTTSPARTRAWV